jgi:fumarate reductase flavoprotein subunit
MDYDLVVIGGGLAGLTAANRAAELGLRPVVLERGADELYPCNSRWAGGLVHLAFKDMTAGADEIHAAIERSTGGLTEAALTHLLADEAERALSWLRGQGAKFLKAGPYEWMRWVLAPPRPRTPGLDWKGRGPDVLLRVLTANLAKRQGRLLRGVAASEIVRDGGRIAGVAAMQDGAAVRIAAPAVLIADGGFQGNAELVARYIAPKADALFQRGAGTGMGDGIRMAEALGARLTGMDRFYGHLLGREVFANEKLWPYPILDHLASAGVLVDASGRRFCDEGLGGVYMANETAKLDDPRGIAVVFDEATWATVGADNRFPPTPNDSFVRAGGAVHAAETLDTLAAKIGIPADVLAETVAAHNRAVEDDGYGVLTPPRSNARKTAKPIAAPPFRAVQACVGITYTMGGIAIDAQARVLSESGDPIPGLYAAGSCTGGAEGGPNAGYIGGLSKAVITGLVAAEHAAAARRG